MKIRPTCNDDRACACRFCEGGNCNVLNDTYPRGRRCPFFKPEERAEEETMLPQNCADSAVVLAERIREIMSREADHDQG